MKNPIQPTLIDKHGVKRFKINKIVEYLLDTHPNVDMNTIALKGFTGDDRQQFAQLIGYSLSGYGDLSYVDDDSYRAALQSTHND